MPMDMLQIWELLSYIVTVVALPFAILIFTQRATILAEFAYHSIFSLGSFSGSSSSLPAAETTS